MEDVKPDTCEDTCEDTCVIRMVGVVLIGLSILRLVERPAAEMWYESPLVMKACYNITYAQARLLKTGMNRPSLGW